MLSITSRGVGSPRPTRIPAFIFYRCLSTAGNKPPFSKILVANRGEIACRVFRSCKKLGIKSVAVYSEADADAVHTRMADEAICIGPAASADSYLRIDRIMEAIKTTGAEAVHPGYGFLSENAHFVEELEKNGIVFIGPKSFAIDAMGDKIHSKRIANEAKVNTIPGYVGEVKDEDELLKATNEIGYPVMIKASAGGGGKGMRVAYSDEEAKQGYRLSKREAAASFGDDTIFVEKFVEEPRHIEIQLLCDGHGNGVYLNERECSIQRRNQKVLEEAPSTFTTPEIRAAMGAQALQLAKAVEYQSAGTVEFLMDKHRNFYFLEMNTRLQVEHPITELISQVDIVEEMIKVAAGHELTLTQDDIGVHGWAVESRVYAEDPYREFLPSTGLLTTYEEPVGEEIRVDTGVAEGSEISMFYDPMISKLVTHGTDREHAFAKMREALDSYRIRGLRHNLAFLRALCDHPKMISGEITTKFIAEHYPDGFHGLPMDPTQWEALCAGVLTAHFGAMEAKSSLAADSYASSIAGEDETVILKFTTGVVLEATKTTKGGDTYVSIKALEVPAPKEGDSAPTGISPGEVICEDLLIQSDYKEGYPTCDVSLFKGGPGGIQTDAKVQILETQAPDYLVTFRGEEFQVSVVDPRVHELSVHMPVVVPMDLSKMVLSPMPGLVYSVNVKEGQEVSIGEEVAVVEAMKMQNALQAPSNGVVKTVLVNAGESVDADQILIELE